MASAWKLLAKKSIFHHKYITVDKWTVRLPNGKHRDFLIGGSPYDFVIVGAVTPDNKFVLIRQYYISQGKRLPSLVAGIIEGRERPLVTARRELREETGYTSRRWIGLGASNKGKYTVGTVYYFLALGARKTRPTEWEETEDIVVLEIERKKLMKMLDCRAIADVFVEVGVRRMLECLK